MSIEVKNYANLVRLFQKDNITISGEVGFVKVHVGDASCSLTDVVNRIKTCTEKRISELNKSEADQAKIKRELRKLEFISAKILKQTQIKKPGGYLARLWSAICYYMPFSGHFDEVDVLSHLKDEKLFQFNAEEGTAAVQSGFGSTNKLNAEQIELKVLENLFSGKASFLSHLVDGRSPVLNFRYPNGEIFHLVFVMPDEFSWEICFWEGGITMITA